MYDLYQIEKFHPLFNALEMCRGVEQDPVHHPEGDVFNHSVQVLMLAMGECDDLDLILAAMLHDVGKRIGSHGHEKYALEMLNGYISDKTAWLIKNHMRFWNFVLGNMKKLSKVKELASHEYLPELVLLARWDKRGRKPGFVPKYDRVKIIDILRERFPQHEHIRLAP